jgi:hypothetical protein
MFEQDDPRLSFVSLKEATVPPAGLIEHIKDRWWVVHPEKGVCYFKTSPLCNASKKIVSERLCNYSWAEARFIPSVFRTINPNDYGD